MVEGMCDMCEGTTMTEYLLKVHLRIAEQGWYSMLVEADVGSPGWGYTVGLADGSSHPELLMIGSKLESTALLLETFATAVIDEGEQYQVGDVIIFDDQRSVRFGEVHQAHLTSGLMNGWERSYGSLRQRPPRLEVLQMTLSDGWFCRCHGGTQIDLSDPAPLPRPSANRAERRRRQRGRHG
jgi:hypothetical protein